MKGWLLGNLISWEIQEQVINREAEQLQRKLAGVTLHTALNKAQWRVAQTYDLIVSPA